ncbi:hypothetical protein M9H77_17326 [Catharanthus roseus]|uniref:Uncharacterized protein n=1 Tax=Catharanthus roseus TaxID=4058 RepID=A0ACC0B496_CATRO|nr:hypothetical protein M9H77_17326 [Catharanthus roseus]
MNRLEERFLVGTGPRIYEIKAALANCKQGGDSVHLVGYSEWWPRNSPQLVAGRGLSPASNSKVWRGGRSGRGGRQQPQMPRTRATDGGRLLEAWANSASVRQE